MLPLSFEFFPPKTDEQREVLERTVERLKPLSPEYVSVTFGAGGSTLSYTGDTNDTATMNVWLIKQVMKKLAENGGKLPDEGFYAGATKP